MDTNPKAKLRPLKVEVVLHGQEQGEELPATRAYLFDQAGRLAGHEPVKREAISFPVDGSQNYRLVVGPDLMGGSKEAPANLAAQLAQANTVSRDVIAQAKQDNLRIAITKFVWFCWWETCIVVHGTVRKLLNPGNPNPQYAPICNGVVQIFQVDLGCTLDQLASFQVLTLRDVIASKLRGLEVAAAKVALIHGPIPPGPLAEAKSIGAAAARLRQATAKTESVSTAAVESVKVERVNRIAPKSALQLDRSASQTEIATTLASLEGAALKQFIVAQKLNLWWLLCELIPDWAFCWQELGEVPIQSDGSFMAEVCFWCPDDFPDLYFEVVQNIDGIDTEIYDPQIACSTYYNYDGSQSVDITVDDAEAVACVPGLPGPSYLYVYPFAIGDTNLSGVDGLETGAGTGLLPGDTPFGGVLDLRLQFHNSLPTDALKYYRWSAKFDGEADFSPIRATVTHFYRQDDYSLFPPTIIVNYIPVSMGPQPVGAQQNLFEIPDHLHDWSDYGGYLSVSAHFDTTGKSGMCTLQLEMFDKNGNYVPCDNISGGPTFKYLMPNLAIANQFTNAPAANIDGSGRLTFRLRIDNNMTVAQLPGVVAATSADPCGFLQYSDLAQNVAIQFVAFHPNNFLDWSLTVARGLSGTVVQDPAPPPSAALAVGYQPTNTSAGSPGVPVNFNNAAGTLLGTCVRAAFAVDLYCRARATNGYGRQYQYDSSALIGFALEHT
jgi:hypothetical protein